MPPSVCFVGEDPGHERRNAIEPVRQQTERSLAGFGNDARHVGLSRAKISNGSRILRFMGARGDLALALISVASRGLAAVGSSFRCAAVFFASPIAPIM